MAVKIRLRRMGAKKKPFYRIIVADSRSPRDGRFIEELGTYDPLKDPSEIKVDGEKALNWIANGAQPTDRVKILLEKAGVVVEPKGKGKGGQHVAAGTSDSDVSDEGVAVVPEKPTEIIKDTLPLVDGGSAE